MNYYDWLVDLICTEDRDCSFYQKVLSTLYSRPFLWSINNDRNRANDGVMLRDIYENFTGLHETKFGPCSVLEMMIALAIRCEDDLMHDPDEGDRTYLWFWEMMDNLGLTDQDDYVFDDYLVNKIIDRFLNREYDPDGLGGPFYIPDFERDLRKIELWYQLNFYIERRFFV